MWFLYLKFLRRQLASGLNNEGFQLADLTLQFDDLLATGEVATVLLGVDRGN